jgi:hypothetical protein
MSTVKRIELSEGITGSARTLVKLQTALEKAGVEFIAADETKGPGVRLSHKRSGKQPKKGEARGPRPRNRRGRSG